MNLEQSPYEGELIQDDEFKYLHHSPLYEIGFGFIVFEYKGVEYQFDYYNTNDIKTCRYGPIYLYEEQE